MKKYTYLSLLRLVTLCLGLLVSSMSQANFPLEGSFQAGKQCPALRSIKKNTNPGNLFIEPGRSYPLKAKNKVAATHYLLMIEGQQRWVKADCGNLSGGVISEQPRTNIRSQDYLLTASWQAAFCQTHQAKKECKSQTAERYDAKHFSLHGLWPQPRNNAYCGVSTTLKAIDRNGKWHLLPELKLSNELRKALDIVMPGTASNLQRHEWYKHGTCYSPEPETYYRDSVRLMQQLNNSAVSRLFAANIGKTLNSQQIRQAFDRDFGRGMGQKVDVRCNRKLIGEIWINLRGPVDANTTLKDLMQNAPDVARLSCKGGKIDPAGF